MAGEPQPNYWDNFEVVRSVAFEVLEYPPVSPVDVCAAVTSLIELLVEDGEMAQEEAGEQTHWFLQGAVNALIFEWTRDEPPTGDSPGESVDPA